MRVFITVLFLMNFCSCATLNTKQNPGQPGQATQVYTPKAANPPVLENKPGVIQNQWQLRQTQEGIPVYTRQINGSPILEYKSNVVIDVPMFKAIALFEDAKQIRRWYYQCVRSELVQHEDPNNTIIYLTLHLPWPVAPRDFVFRRTKTTGPDGSITYSLTALPDRLPLVKGMIRVRTIQSFWTFKSISKDQTEMFFQQHTDPAGSVPPSIVNKIGVFTPLYSLKSFRKLLTGKDA